MNYCVLVKVSKRNISFWYQSEKSPYAPLVIENTNEAPLYFYVSHNDFIFGNAARDRFYSNDPNAFGDYFEIVKDPAKHFSIYGSKKPVKQLFYYGIEQYLSHFINVVLYKSDSIESYRPHFPLRFLFEADIEGKEKTLVENLFTETGYNNVGRVDYHAALFTVLCEKGLLSVSKPVLLLTGIDNVLYLDLFKTAPGPATASLKLEGQGSDPRVKILADMIIEYITAQNSYLLLDKELEMAALLTYAAGLLENVKPIIKGEATLTDGKGYYFRVNERSLNERLLFLSGDSEIYTAIDDLVKKHELDVQSTTILLAGEAINTHYFSNKLLKRYPNVKGINMADELDTMKLIFYRISEEGYTVQTAIPDVPPVMPGPTAKSRPELPTAKPKIPDPPPARTPPVLPPKKSNEVIKSPPLPEGVNLNMLIGKEGVVTSDLSLNGIIKIEDKTYEATAAKGTIIRGAKVKVIGISQKKYLQVEKMSLPPLPPKK